MQKELIDERHIHFLKNELGLDIEAFLSMAQDDLNALIDDKLLWMECDAAEELDRDGQYSEKGQCAIELIDIICGPYDPDEINVE